MTDGIIQQVFQKYYYKFESHEQDMLNKMEQELIEKIKQECYTTGQTIAYRYKVRDWITLEQLIGDNQE